MHMKEALGYLGDFDVPDSDLGAFDFLGAALNPAGALLDALGVKGAAKVIIDPGGALHDATGGKLLKQALGGGSGKKRSTGGSGGLIGQVNAMMAKNARMIRDAKAAVAKAEESPREGTHGMRMTGDSGPTDMERMMMTLANKPRIQARSSSEGGTKDAAMISAIATRVRSELAPEMNAINKKLGLAANQNQATSEHNYLNNTTNYRKKVIGDLMAMRARLPADDPRRGRIMRVGILSGFM